MILIRNTASGKVSILERGSDLQLSEVEVEEGQTLEQEGLGFIS